MRARSEVRADHYRNTLIPENAHIQDAHRRCPHAKPMNAAPRTKCRRPKFRPLTQVDTSWPRTMSKVAVGEVAVSVAKPDVCAAKMQIPHNEYHYI